MNTLQVTLRRFARAAFTTLATLALSLSLVQSAGAVEPLVFDSAEMEERFNQLTEELRCLVCQNQSLADSDAVLAQDLRNEVFVMLQQGNSNEEIKRFLVDRYGDFVLYRPPLRQNTLLLWLSPLLLFTIGGVIMAFTISRRRVMLAEQALEEAQLELTAGQNPHGKARLEGDDGEPRS